MQGNANLARPAVPPKVEQVEALSRAVNGLSLGNYPAIFAGLVAKGIPESSIKPRQNVFTYSRPGSGSYSVPEAAFARFLFCRDDRMDLRKRGCLNGFP